MPSRKLVGASTISVLSMLGNDRQVPGDTYGRLLALLERNAVMYRLIDHAPEGRTELVSALRGHAPSQAAKCIVLFVKCGRHESQHVLGVVPGDRRVDLAAVRALYRAHYVGFASREAAERLSGAAAGSVLPFSLNADMEVVVDPALLENSEIFFNAARLDRSIVLSVADYVAVTRPRIEVISQQRSESPSSVELPDPPPGGRDSAG